MKKLLVVLLLVIMVVSLTGCDKVVNENTELVQTITPSEYTVEQVVVKYNGVCLVHQKVGDVQMCTLYQQLWRENHEYYYNGEHIWSVRVDSGMSVSPIIWYSRQGNEIEGTKDICKYERTREYESGNIKTKTIYDYCE